MARVHELRNANILKVKANLHISVRITPEHVLSGGDV